MPTIEQMIDFVTVEWDSDKYDLNIAEHDVTFEEALSVILYDDKSFTNEDYRKYETEQRYITIGFSHRGRLLYVVWTLREVRYRIISARKANKHEERGYYNG